MSKAAPSHSSWHEANRRALSAALARVRAALEARANPAASAASATEAPSRDSENAAEARSSPSALELLCTGFNLSPFERDVVLLCAGMELESAFGPLCATLHGDPRRTQPTFGLALATLPDGHWSALAPDSALRRWRLVELGPGDSLVSSPLRLDERVLHFLLGMDGCDARLRSLVVTVGAPDQLAPSGHQQAAQIAALWQQTSPGDYPLIQLVGRDTSSAAAVAAAACSLVDIRLLALRASDLPATPVERETLACVCEREFMLSRSALLIDLGGDPAPDEVLAVAALGDLSGGIVIVTGEGALRLRRRTLARIEVRPPSPEEQRALWREALGSTADTLNGQVDLVAMQFQLTPAAIRTAALEVLQREAATEARGVGALLWDACRAQTRPRVRGLAQRIESLATWDDLVLPASKIQVLRTLAAHVRQRARVYDAWGFGRKSDRGLGIAAVFSGGTGTGKTMAAEVIANDLRLDLYRVDLSALVDKFVGETEKNLRRVFDAAETGGAILLFDEADAIFGRRSEVRDSHDRYANIEVGYLLQRIETYRGLVLLTTNQPQSLDPAFARRLRFIVQFPYPDLAQRTEIWRRVFPAQTPTENLQVEKLSRLNLTGGQIRNLALNAAFLAADASEPVRMTHLLAAAQPEFAKMEKPLTAADTAGWV